MIDAHSEFMIRRWCESVLFLGFKVGVGAAAISGVSVAGVLVANFDDRGCSSRHFSQPALHMMIDHCYYVPLSFIVWCPFIQLYTARENYAGRTRDAHGREREWVRTRKL